MGLKDLIKEVAEKIEHDNKIEKELKDCIDNGPRYTQRELAVVQLARKYDSFIKVNYGDEQYREGYIKGYKDRDNHRRATYF